MVVSLSKIGIPFPIGQKIYAKRENADTKDIVKAIMFGEADIKEMVYTKPLAKYLRRSTAKATMKAVFDFVVYNIPYKADGLIQSVESPAVTLYTRKNLDCKSFAVLTADLMRALGYRYEYVLISQNENDSDPTHVFLAAYTEGGERVVLDSVYKKFNKEPFSTFRKIIEMT